MIDWSVTVGVLIGVVTTRLYLYVKSISDRLYQWKCPECKKTGTNYALETNKVDALDAMIERHYLDSHS